VTQSKSPTLLLSGAMLAALMRPSDYLAAVERGVLASRDGRAVSPLPMQLDAAGGAFHAKAAVLDGEYAALKLNGNFPGNPARGLPTIQGAILLCDAHTGALLAIMDSIEITLRRTAAATALAARCLARPESSVLALCGCGAQARAQVEALRDVLPLQRARVWDKDAAKAQDFARQAGEDYGLPFEASSALRAATLSADVIVTCTTARAAFLDETHVSPGAFIAAVGADNPDKSEITPSLMARAGVVTDVLEQCTHIGDLHHAIAAGLMTRNDVRAELSDVAAGARRGREAAQDIIIFDSTGAGVQDVASAALAYQRARERGAGVPFAFSA
jgi:ornithine cyclodeaminase/alanine dehydrogenase-like protein (mu-crystallin family)